jgi:thiamine transport system substrate-binding protein
MTQEGNGRPRHRRTVRIGRLLTVAVVVLVVLLASYAGYAYLKSRPAAGGATTIVVYTYASLLGGGCGGTVISGLLAQFDEAYHANVEVECPSGTLVSTLVAQKNAPGADVVVGLDEVTAPEAVANGLLLPYASPQLSHVNASLVDELGAGSAATPYEWGYLAIDYNLSFASASGGAVARATFANFSSNATWASSLMVEDPTVDITGEEFLLWEIAYEQYLAHGDWRSWWQSVDPHLHVAPDWTSAWNAFTAPTNGEPMIACYATDPADAAYYGSPNSFNATVSWLNGTPYGWRAIYGLGIVNGSKTVSLDEQFVDWFLSGSVQSQLPTTEWEYPANASTPLPPAFQYSLDPTTIVPLNAEIPPSMIVASLPTWLDEWQTLANEYG